MRWNILLFLWINDYEFEIIIYFCFIRRRRTITVYKMVFNEEPGALIWEENAMPQPSSRLILTPNLNRKGLKSVHFLNVKTGKSFNLALKVSWIYISILWFSLAKLILLQFLRQFGIYHFNLVVYLRFCRLRIQWKI